MGVRPIHLRFFFVPILGAECVEAHASGTIEAVRDLHTKQLRGMGGQTAQAIYWNACGVITTAVKA